jgi:formate/nitrite transporter
MADDPSAKDIAAAAPELLAAKAKRSFGQTLLLAIAAGVLIGIGSIAFLIAQAVPGGPSGPTQLLSGLAFSVGLILVTITGAELFTGNAMQVLPATHGELRGGRMLLSWAVVWIGNLIGSIGLALLFFAAGGGEGLDGGIATAAVDVARSKVGKEAVALLASGVLANLLVCLAVWAAMAATSIPAKVLAIIGPVTVFVAAGLEHSIANQSLLPIGWLLQTEHAIGVDGIAYNLALSTAGNLIGGALVALALYHGHGGPTPESRT